MPGAESIKALGALMDRRKDPPSGENDCIPQGYTYLGQFIDHDITFDPTPMPDRRCDPHALVNFRTPRYDLDSVYGAGPVAQPYLYDRGSAPSSARLLVGRSLVDGKSADPPNVRDLPRNQQGRALIGDARNDEHVIIAQLHLLFIRFHNAVVASVGDFDEAQQIVRWHYQWIVVHDFLPKVVGQKMADRVLAPAFRREYFTWKREPFIPVEFAGAAFRFGHSMVRDRYGLKRPPSEGNPPPSIPLFPDLDGSRWLPQELVIDWERFFDLSKVLPGADSPRSSMAIDTRISKPLFNLPDDGGSLPLRNLLRGLRLELPSGQEVARAMEVNELDDDQLLLDGIKSKTQRKELLRATPLWYYILCEAEHHSEGAHLGPVGGRIVAEVLLGLLEGDPSSYLSTEPGWQPREFGTDCDFTMADLVEFAQPPD